MAQNIKIKKGLDIPLSGSATEEITAIRPLLVGIYPADFEGHAWKNCVKEGDTVNSGSPILKDKATGKIHIVSPVSGTVKELRRGERRKIISVVIEPDNENSSHVTVKSVDQDKESIREALLQSGLWAWIRQRPFDIVPDPDNNPRDIFITTFDSAPLAPVILSDDQREDIERGLRILSILCGKKPYIGLRPGVAEFANAENLIVDGPHPAGNVGVQIAAVKPVNKGETVWTLNSNTVAKIGRLFNNTFVDWTVKVAVTGPMVENPHFVETIVGCDIRDILKGFKLKSDEDIRIISGNVLTGKTVEKDTDFLRFPYYQISVIKEGKNADEFMGWASMNPNKYSVKRTFPAFLKGLSKPFPFDARIKGGRRAMILSGELDKVFPFDIYPEYLIRSMLSGDIDRMEKLGIYEVAPEDFALPEFVDTSKQELQSLVRSSLDKIRNDE